jgi:hypothetical protein
MKDNIATVQATIAAVKEEVVVAVAADRDSNETNWAT